jgi:hypothetical protein
MPLFNNFDYALFQKTVGLLRSPYVLKLALMIMLMNIALFHARRVIPRLCGRWGYRCLYLSSFLVLFGLAPGLVFCVVILKLTPVFLGGSGDISLGVLLLYWRQICLLTAVIVPIGISLYLIPYIGQFLRRHPQFVDAVLGILLMRFVGELVIYVRYPDHLLMSYYEKMFPPFVLSAVFICSAWLIEFGLNTILKKMGSGRKWGRYLKKVIPATAVVTQFVPVIIQASIFIREFERGHAHYREYKYYCKRKKEISPYFYSHRLFFIKRKPYTLSSELSYMETFVITSILIRIDSIALGERIWSVSENNPDKKKQPPSYTPLGGK